MTRLTATDELITKIRSFGALQPNWNGYGGLTPSSSAVEECVRLLHDLGALSILPIPTISGDGEVGLFWEHAETTIEIGFRGDGVYGYLLDVPKLIIVKENASLADVRGALSVALRHMSL